VAGWLLRIRRTVFARTPGGAFRAAVLAMVMVAVGVTATAALAAAPRAVSLRVGYACAFPSGSRSMSAQITATFPEAGVAGQPIQPTGIKITLTLPQAAVSGLVRLNRSTVTLTAWLGADVTEGMRSASALWRDFRSPAVAIPRSGPLRFTASGAVPPVTVTSPGNIIVTATGLSLVFTARTRNGRPAGPSGMQAACLPRPGQDTALARIAVTGSATGAPAPAKTNPMKSGPSKPDPAKCLPFPTGLKLNPRFPLPKPLPGSRAFHQPQRACSYAAGYTNARKLDEAALVGPGLIDLRLGLTTYTKFTSYSYIQQNVAGQLEYHGLPELPPARATFLAFGFMPVSATLQLSEIGSLNAALISCAPTPKCPYSPPSVALFFGRVTLRIYDVNVNGVSLNAGPHCQTATPFNLELTGLPPAYNVSLIKGVLTGTVTVPRFKDCSDGTDNLNRIFDASVSGPGNFVKITQALLCTPKTGGGCPPAKPVPTH
jgi:hypothetical protein